MENDSIAAALRRDAELMRDFAPVINAAALWNKVQRGRAQRLRRIMNLCGWALRASLLLVIVAVTLLAPQALSEFVLPLMLVGWLSAGICSPLAPVLAPKFRHIDSNP